MKKQAQATWVLEFHEVHPFNPDPPPDMVCLWFWRGHTLEDRPPFCAAMMDDIFPAESYHERFFAWCLCPLPPPNFVKEFNKEL